MLQFFHEIQNRCYKVVHTYFTEQLERKMSSQGIQSDAVYVGRLMRGSVEDMAVDMVRRRNCINEHYQERVAHLDLFIEAAILFKLFEQDLTPYLDEQPVAEDPEKNQAIEIIQTVAKRLDAMLSDSSELSVPEQIKARWQVAQDESIRFYSGLHKLFGCSKSNHSTIYFFGCDRRLNGYNHPSWTLAKSGRDTIKPTLLGEVVIINMIRPIQLSVTSGAQITDAYVQILSELCHEACQKELFDHERRSYLQKLQHAEDKIEQLESKLLMQSAIIAELSDDKAKIGEELSELRKKQENTNELLKQPAAAGNQNNANANEQLLELKAKQGNMDELLQQLSETVAALELKQAKGSQNHLSATMPWQRGPLFSNVLTPYLHGSLLSTRINHLPESADEEKTPGKEKKKPGDFEVKI